MTQSNVHFYPTHSPVRAPAMCLHGPKPQLCSPRVPGETRRSSSLKGPNVTHARPDKLNRAVGVVYCGRLAYRTQQRATCIALDLRLHTTNARGTNCWILKMQPVGRMRRRTTTEEALLSPHQTYHCPLQLRATAKGPPSIHKL